MTDVTPGRRVSKGETGFRELFNVSVSLRFLAILAALREMKSSHAKAQRTPREVWLQGTCWGLFLPPELGDLSDFA